jgi:hypothetical protein
MHQQEYEERDAEENRNCSNNPAAKCVHADSKLGKEEAAIARRDHHPTAVDAYCPNWPND